jgi:hypothetical protein
MQKNKVSFVSFNFFFLLFFGNMFEAYADITLVQTFTEKNIKGTSSFGYSVSDAGDVNGDGFDDVIIGAYAYKDNTGRAYIYFGSADTTKGDIANVILEGEGTGDEFAASIACACDVNSDGFDDVIVGAPGYNYFTGRVYIYFGAEGNEMDSIPDIILNGDEQDNRFGISVSGADDMNGDQFSDVVIGADGFNSNTGRVFVFFGSLGITMDDTPDIIFDGEETDNHFGISVSNAGDVNSDNFDDLIIGAKGFDSNRGRAYIFFGAAESLMDDVADIIFEGENTGNNFGFSVSQAGDVNGDSFSDIIIGAYGYKSGTGRSYIYFGYAGAAMDSIPDVTFQGEHADNYFGYSLSYAGDINGDNFDDIIIGAWRYSSYTGRVYVYFGAEETSMDSLVDIIFDGKIVDENFGFAVSNAGDFNGDNIDDMIIGARRFNSNTGCANIYFGAENSSLDNSEDIVFIGEGDYNNFGRSVSNAGDVNGDGYDDIIIGAEGYNSHTGRVYIYFGSSEAIMDSIPDVILEGEERGSRYGFFISSAGDVNGDNFADVIVGAPGYNSRTGRAYIYFGADGFTMDNNADVIVDGETPNGHFAECVSSAGDINCDGFDEVIVGAYRINNSTGRAYVYFGSSGTTMDNTPDLIFDGENQNDKFAYSVACAGDVNGDSYDDMIVGAMNAESTGCAYLYFGAPSNVIDNIADIKFQLDDSYGFGNSVAGAGDVNGDGYDDILIAGWYYYIDTGRAYLYFGADDATMDTIPDVIMEGEGIWHRFGTSVSSAGDVNGDSFDDVFIGAWMYNDYAGRGYIYLGGFGTSMDNSPDVILDGDGNSNKFCWSVSGAGDVNGDNYDDVMISAYLYPMNGIVYLYSGGPLSPRTTVLTFTAIHNNRQNILEWTTGMESNTIGFNIFSSRTGFCSQPGFYCEKINDNLIETRGSETKGTNYVYIDEAEELGDYYYKLQGVSFDGTTYFYGSILMNLTSVNKELIHTPTKYYLSQNYPNPFNQKTTIEFGLSKACFIELLIYDINGKLVKELILENKPAGIHRLKWDGRNQDGFHISSGVYLYVIKAGDLSGARIFKQTQKMILIK